MFYYVIQCSPSDRSKQCNDIAQYTFNCHNHYHYTFYFPSPKTSLLKGSIEISKI